VAIAFSIETVSAVLAARRWSWLITMKFDSFTCVPFFTQGRRTSAAIIAACKLSRTGPNGYSEA
jgi:hypothetical protein